MIDKIKKVLENLLVIFFLLILPVQLTYMLYNRKQLTSRSFQEISLLNSEIKKLETIDNEVFRDKENLIFTVNKHIAPKIFNKYYFLESYIFRYDNVTQYYPLKDKLKNDGIPEEDLINLSKKDFFCSDSIRAYLEKLTFDKKYVYYSDYYTYDTYTIYTLANISDLIINEELIKKLRSIKDVPYHSTEEFEQALREIIGVDNFKKYSGFIESTIDNTAKWQRVMLYSYLLAFALIIVSRLVIAFILGEHKKKAADQEIDDNIDKARQNIDEKPGKITPVWDLANYTLQKYYNKNLSQVNSIYKLSIIVMSMGFLLIISILIATIYFQIEVRLESIGIIAGIITEFIGATFLFIYKSTIRQALQHSKSLEDINKVGMSIKIIESITENATNKEKIDNAKIKIAKKLITTHNTRYSQ